MHRVSPFVHQRGHRLVVVVVVHEDKGVHVVRRAVHVSARELARPRIDVHPAVLQAGGHRRHVTLAERLHRFEHHLLALIDRVLARAAHQGRVDVVVAHLALDAEQPCPQPEVTVQGGQVPVGLRDQGFVDGGGNAFAIERAREGVRVLAQLGVDRVLLQALVEGDAESALELLPGAEERVENLLAVVAVRRFPVFGIGRLVELHFLAVGKPDRRPGQLRVRENLVGRARGLLRQGKAGDDALTPGGGLGCDLAHERSALDARLQEVTTTCTWVKRVVFDLRAGQASAAAPQECDKHR